MTIMRKVAAFVLLLSVPPVQVVAQGVEALKAGVVRITANVNGLRKSGTGFIVSLDKDAAYIVTASHVIKGDDRPEVYFFPQPEKPRRAEVIGSEDDDQRGLAVIRVAGQLPADLVRIGLDAAFKLDPGETVTLIGFPLLASTPWAVTEAVIAGRSGTAITFSGAADGGSSGGPMLRNGWATGVVTTKAGEFGFAIPAVSVVFALEGWGVKLFDAGRPVASESIQPLPPGASLEKTKIAFQYYDNDKGHEGIYVMDTNGRNIVRVMEMQGTSPSWSSDGRSIIFVSVQAETRFYGIYSVDVASGKTRLLIKDAGKASEPRWSPDGTKIAFITYSGLDTLDVFVAAADGTNRKRLTHQPSSKYSLFWSPGGTMLGFSQVVRRVGETFVMDADGANLRRFSTPLQDFLGTGWSPDGRKIVGESIQDGYSAIYTTNADGSDPKRLTNNPAGDHCPSWSPDGTKIVFISKRDGHEEIYLMNADGSNQTRLTFDKGKRSIGGPNTWNPVWSPFPR